MAGLAFYKTAVPLQELSLASAFTLYSIPSFWLGLLLIAWLGLFILDRIHLLGLHAPGKPALVPPLSSSLL